jgi:hypothetical protein
LQSTRAASAPPARCAPCTRPGGLGGAVAASFRAMGGKPTFRLPTVLAAAAPKKKKKRVGCESNLCKRHKSSRETSDEARSFC